ncbi:MAG: dihydroorotase [Kiritimatiellaeota bacterium]|nr:dihydroorotase [Kiritimatiellota bacterium]
MAENNKYVLANGRVIDPISGTDSEKEIGVSDGRIVDPSTIPDAERVDISGCVAAPGFIDLHTHLRQPGNTDAETITTATTAAAAGGFTSIVAMPNTSPVADNAGTLEYIRKHANEEGVVNVFLCASLTKDLKGEEMTSIGSLKQFGVVALTDDGRCVQNHELMRHIMEYASSFDLPVFDHCEDDVLAGDGVMHEGHWSTLLGLRGIPAASEELMVARDLILAEMTDTRVHIQHISSAGSVRQVREARKRGVKVTAEATPHHISLTDENLKSFDSNFKMKPPLMSEEHRQTIIEGLADGTIEAIATDHAPHTKTSKLVEFDYAPFGIVGLETAFPVCFTELVESKRLTLPELVAKFTTGPAGILGVEAGTLTEGAMADITIFSPEAKHVVDSSKFHSKSTNTPFDGREFRGKIMGTIVKGNPVFSENLSVLATL